MIAIFSAARSLPPEIAAISGGAGGTRAAVIDLGRAPAHGRDLLDRLRRLLADRETEAVALVLDDDAPFGDAALALLAAEAWRKPVVVHFTPEKDARRQGMADTRNVVSFAHGRRRRTLRALSGMGIAVAASPARLEAELTRALERRPGEWPRNRALLDFASAIRWVDRNVY